MSQPGKGKPPPKGRGKRPAPGKAARGRRSPAPLDPAQANRALAFKMIGLTWEGVAEQLDVKPARAHDLVREALGMPGASDDEIMAELDRQRHETLFARTQARVSSGDPSAIRTAARLMATRPRKPAKPTLDPLRSAVRRGMARGLPAKRILVEFPECKKHTLGEINRILREEHVIPAATPQAQRFRRVAELEALKREAPDTKTLLSAMRLLVKFDGSMDAAVVTLYAETWALVGRIEDFPLPERVAVPPRPKSDAERQLWRARLQRLRHLLWRAADDVAAFRRLGPPPVGVVIAGDDPAAQKVGRMSLLNLYAQEHVVTALHLAATNPALSPAQRGESVSKLVATAAINHQGAETSEFAKNLLDKINAETGDATSSTPKGKG